MQEHLQAIIEHLDTLSLHDKIEAINEIKIALHKISPHKNEPVDCVIWKHIDNVRANDYNPNAVASPEMELLKLSILADGYTQPIVTWHEETDDMLEIIDGFHRNRCGREVGKINKRIHGYLPVVVANSDRTDKADRMSSTIRHNRARGTHNLQIMSDIVVDLVRRKKTDEWIAKELGMCVDEVLRLKQTSGLADLFTDQEFSEAWDIDFSEQSVDDKEENS